MLNLYGKRVSRKLYNVMLVIVLMFAVCFSRTAIMPVLVIMNLVPMSAGRLNDLGWPRWIALIMVPTILLVNYVERRTALDPTLSPSAWLLIIFYVGIGLLRSRQTELAADS